MSKKRYVDTKFWVDNYIVERDPIEKLLYLYLLTNTLTNILGIYEISIRQIAFDTGIDKDMVIKILERFSKDNKIRYINGYIAIKKFVKYQADNPKINKGIELLLKEVPIDLIEWIDIDFDRLDITEDSLYIGLDKTSSDSNYTNTNTNPNTNSNVDAKTSPGIFFNYEEGKFEGITNEYKSELKIKYPDRDIDMELKRMADWLIDKPADDPNIKKQGKRTFINDWLKNNYNKPTKEDDDDYDDTFVDLRKEMGI